MILNNHRVNKDFILITLISSTNYEEKAVKEKHP